MIEKEIAPKLSRGEAALIALERKTGRVDDEFLKKYQDEIDSTHDAFGENKSSPGTYELAKQIVAGRHISEIRESVKASLLQQMKDGSVEIPGRKPAKDKSEGPPSARELVKAGVLSPEHAKVIEGMGGEDEFAYRMTRGKKSWAEFSKKYRGEAE